MKYLLLTLCLTNLALFAYAQQPERSQLSLTFGSEKSEIQRLPIDAQPFLSYYITQAWQEDVAYESFQIRFSENGTAWTDWQTLTQDHHHLADEKQWVSALNYTESEYRYYQYRWTDEQQPQKLELHFYSPDHTPSSNTNWRTGLETRSSCECPQPDFETRSDWCTTCPSGSSPAEHNVTHLIIHHSAGTNTASDWAAIVRSIWDFHVDGRGWDDIGYNWLIDPNGVLYAGRATDIRGAHFCGNNTGTEGVCVLGDFTAIVPTDTAMQTLTELWAWKSCENALIPRGFSYHASSGRTLPVISGHRNGCATACPGDSFYPLLQSVRDSVDVFQQACTAVSTEEISTAQISIFPNPTQANLHIKLPETWQGRLVLRLHSITGKVLLEQDAVVQSVLDVSLEDFAAGIYLLEVLHSGQRRTFKVMKQ